MIEGLSSIYHQLCRTGVSSRSVRRVYRISRRVVLISVMALRRAHFELWQQQAEHTPLGELDGEEPPPASQDPAGPPPELT